MKFHKGHDFKGPDGQGYILTNDVGASEMLKAEHFKPYGGAPEPKEGEPIPRWLVEQI